MKIAVGSLNPVKLAAVKEAFSIVWPDTVSDVIGVVVISGVSAQPMSDIESIKGAINRAKKSITEVEADYGVGLEGGLQKIGERWFDCGWIAVIDNQGYLGIASTAKVETPPKIITMVKEGMELGYVLPKSLIVKIIPQLNTLASDDVQNHLFYQPVKEPPPFFRRHLLDVFHIRVCLSSLRFLQGFCNKLIITIYDKCLVNPATPACNSLNTN